MSYLLDTNIISEPLRTKPNPQVLLWLNRLPPKTQFLSVLSLGEIRRDIEKLQTSRRKNHLLSWLENELMVTLAPYILPIDAQVAERWGYLLATVQRPIAAVDGLLAATALTHNLKLVTRNVHDFEVPGLEVINPFA